MDHGISRRTLLKTLGAAGAVLAAPGVAQAAVPAVRPRALRLAHMTDWHCQPGDIAMDGVRQALRHVAAQADPPSLILTGGDSLHLGMTRTEPEIKEMTGLWRTAVTDEIKVPVRHCIGNHDIWGWDKSTSQTTGNEPLWGKMWAQEAFGLERPYYAFDQAGWRFIVLDSVQPLEASYQGGVDDEQLEWLRGELARDKGAPTVVLTHVPVLQGCVLNSDASRTEEGIQIGLRSLILNGWALCRLFEENPQVKLCLTGHIHFHDRTDIAGVAHFCSGAVSGTWWRTPEDDRARRAIAQGADAPPRLLRATAGYSLVDLYEDGGFDVGYVTYGWKLGG